MKKGTIKSYFPPFFDADSDSTTQKRRNNPFFVYLCDTPNILTT